MKNAPESHFHRSHEAQFGDFFKKNYQTSCLIALKYVKDYHLAEDLVQDVFVAFWEKNEIAREHSNLKNYFFTAVKNHAINVIQRNKSLNTSLSELFIDLPEEDTTSSYSQEELAVKVYKAIQELPPGCQVIFKLAYEQNYSYQEIANQLKVSKNTVKTQMGIAYKQLRSKLHHLTIMLFHIFKNK